MNATERVPTEPLLETLNWTQYERALVLSPHLDDGALSCGSLLLALSGRVSRLVVTIGCADPLPRSDRARPRRGYATPASRRRADRAAMRSIACDFVHLGFADCIYRRGPISGELIYRYRRQLWLPPAVEDAAHIEELYLVLARICSQIGRVLLVAPLGIGRHVDHAICARLALRLAGPRCALLFYEDFPYVVDPSLSGLADDPLAALARLALRPRRRLALACDVRRQAALIRHYKNEVAGLFGDSEGIVNALRARTLDGVPAEIYWQVHLPARSGRASLTGRRRACQTAGPRTRRGR